ncbi:hypothetical protein SUGI_0132550 [Cryptomeria japonica]|nr:hypothetical protein SUGI_0132550 [Cryptomeria japonica]
MKPQVSFSKPYCVLNCKPEDNSSQNVDHHLSPFSGRAKLIRVLIAIFSKDKVFPDCRSPVTSRVKGYSASKLATSSCSNLVMPLNQKTPVITGEQVTQTVGISFTWQITIVATSVGGIQRVILAATYCSNQPKGDPNRPGQLNGDKLR